MYVIIRRFRAMTDVDEVARRAMAGLAPALKEAPGFAGYHVFDERGGGGLHHPVREPRGRRGGP
ncbi:hypothetical protein [Geminicoccus harenae]|uniref:hypothetical protein n=1 Tax=Geminicoccus harenae TaxID=2498453 RepID=UPI001C947169|nr:hypothetical protein [Geminicoccus harenae]